MAMPEYDEVERPLIDQLVAMGWEHLEGAPPGVLPQDPSCSGRTDFQTVLLEDRLRAAVVRLNPGPDGQPWLDERRVQQIVDQLVDRELSPIAGNLAFTRLMRTGLTVEGLPDWEHDVNQNVRLINVEEPERNDLVVISQFRIDRPERNAVVPDLVLFVNGLPVVVIECKRPGPGALDDAVDQVINYAGAYAPAPVRELVRYGQLLIATCREKAQLGTVTAEAPHFASWRTVEPGNDAKVRKEVGRPPGQPLSAQEELVAGVLRPAHLLLLMRDFMVDAGPTVKIVGRWQQFRAVHRIIANLNHRNDRIAHGEDSDHRGGIVWHTQGSGKSLTMAFLIRTLRRTRELRASKVVVVTDRIDLQTQIRGSLSATDETPHIAPDVDSARDYLSRQASDLVMILIQKARHDDDGSELDVDVDDRPGTESPLPDPCNLSSSIIVLIDEAHRSQDGVQHARLRAMLPNATLIGFTGTPIIKGNKKRTDEIFGDVIDVYSLKDARDDRSIVPITYEARLPNYEIIRRAALDRGFDVTVGGTRRQRRRAMRRLARKREVLEAEQVIEFKARDMFWHWAQNAMPDGFAAQIVAVSRVAAVRYREAVLVARDELVERLDSLDSKLAHDPMAAEYASRAELRLLRLLNWRDLLASIDIAVVISEKAGVPDPESWRQWTRRSDQDQHILRFKQGFDSNEWIADQPWSARAHGGPLGSVVLNPSTVGDPWDVGPPGLQPGPATNTGAPKQPLAFLVVKSMLLTGFDAPVEQVLYLDRGMGGVELLQAMARTNRPYRNKRFGLIVDYVGVFRDMRRALNDYEREHLRVVMGGDGPPAQSVWQRFDESAIPDLQSQHQRLVEFLAELGVTHLNTSAAREDLLARLWDDPQIRARFDERARDFLSAMNAVLPRPQALRYNRFAKQLGEVQFLARSRFRDDRTEFSPRRYGAKVRALIDKHLRVTQVEQRVPPRDLTIDGYLEALDNLDDDRARAMEMASALRSRIDVRLPTAVDRARYERLSEHLDRITQSMEQDFVQAAGALFDLVMDERDVSEAERSAGLAHFTDDPVRRLVERMLIGSGQVLPQNMDVALVVQDVVVELAELAAQPNFPEQYVVREAGVRSVIGCLEREHDLYDVETEPLARELVDLAARGTDHFRRRFAEGTT